MTQYGNMKEGPEYNPKIMEWHCSRNTWLQICSLGKSSWVSVIMYFPLAYRWWSELWQAQQQWR